MKDLQVAPKYWPQSKYFDSDSDRSEGMPHSWQT